MTVEKKRILKELENMIANQIMNSVEVDIAAKEIYEKFIEPAITYAKIKDDEHTKKETH